MASLEDIMPRLKKLEVELDKSVLKNAELMKLTTEQSAEIDELKKKFDRAGSGKSSADEDFTTRTWFWTCLSLAFWSLPLRLTPLPPVGISKVIGAPSALP